MKGDGFSLQFSLRPHAHSREIAEARAKASVAGAERCTGALTAWPRQV